MSNLKLDLKKKLKGLYRASAKAAVVNVPPLNILAVDGYGDPSGEEFKEAIQVLYPLAYKIKFAAKKAGRDFGVMPLEGLWWADDMTDFVAGRRNRWRWTLFIVMPDFVKQADLKAASAFLSAKPPAALGRVRLATLKEKMTAQVMYVGPYADEGPTIVNLHTFIKEYGGHFDGQRLHHHEIYLSDARRTAAAKLKTIIRQPFEMAKTS
jgi:hypothetical protein